jgi:hypothetical protein
MKSHAKPNKTAQVLPHMNRHAYSMPFVKAFADLNPFNIPASGNNIRCFHDAWVHVFIHPVWNQVTQNFFEELIERCNQSRQQPLSCHVQAKQTTMVKYKPPFTVKLADLMLALVVAQFGPRHFPDIGPDEPTAAEVRYFQSCSAFTQALRDVLGQTGLSDTATCKTVSQDLADRVRFLVVEVGEARKAHFVADAPFQYARVSRKLDRLFSMLHSECAVCESAWKSHIQLQILSVMNSEMTLEQLSRYVESRRVSPLSR